MTNNSKGRIHVPLNMTNVISLFDDDQDHQLLINPPLVAHLEPFTCKQSKVRKNPIYILNIHILHGASQEGMHRLIICRSF